VEKGASSATHFGRIGAPDADRTPVRLTTRIGFVWISILFRVQSEAGFVSVTGEYGQK
jgi:hypothetical protein